MIVRGGGRLRFQRLPSGKHNGEAQLCAFDVLALDSDHLQKLHWASRTLKGFLRGRRDGIFINPFEIGTSGPDLFRAVAVQAGGDRVEAE